MRRLISLFACAALLLGCSSTSLSSVASSVAPQQRTDYSGFLVVTSVPEATDAGAEILRRGGTAADAAVTIQTVLGLVEAPSSGVGGGAFMVYRDGKTGEITTYDGREVAPAATRPGQFLGEDGRPSFDKWTGGLSVGVPGAMAMLALAQQKHGALPWASLFDPAIALADGGFKIDEHVHELAARTPGLKVAPGVAGYLFEADGEPLPVGTVVRNTRYAKTMRALAENPRAINEGPIAQDIANAVNKAFKHPQAMTLKDLASYEAKEREPVCGPYRKYTVCGMGPPSSGGITVLQILGMLERFPLAALGPKDPESWHLIAEAERLAFADRAYWLADGDVVSVPVKVLIDRDYLKARSALIDLDHAVKEPREAGNPLKKSAAIYAPAQTSDRPSTTHFTVVDKAGNVAAVTSSIQTSFGSHIFVDGFFLNNELTDFAFVPKVNGKPVANAAGPGKRPLSSMSPTIVLDKDGKLVMAIGSPGGVRIITYVVKAIVAALDWNMPMQEAVDLPNFGNLNGATNVEEGPGAKALKTALEAMGHEVSVGRGGSSLQGFKVVPGGYDGGSDKRRDGKIAGDKPLSTWPHLKMPGR